MPCRVITVHDATPGEIAALRKNSHWSTSDGQGTYSFYLGNIRFECHAKKEPVLTMAQARALLADLDIGPNRCVQLPDLLDLTEGL